MQKKIPQIMQKIFRRTLRQKSFFSVKLPGNFIKLTPTHVHSRRKLASKKERAESIGDNVKNSHRDSDEKVESESKAESVVLEKILLLYISSVTKVLLDKWFFLLSFLRA